MLTLLLLPLGLAYAVWTFTCLETNVRRARALGVPVVRVPFGGDNLIWLIVQPLLWAFLNRFNRAWTSYPDFIRFSHRNWQFLEKSRPAARFGSVWALVSPAGISLYFSDPHTIEEIYSRWRDFVRPVHKYRMLAIYGPSVFTAELDDWPRHRKAVAAPFNEDLMKQVWEEALRHTSDMLHSWTIKFDGKVTDLEGDLRVLTFNVLASTAFPESNQGEGTKDRKEIEASTQSHREILHVVLEHAIILMLIPYRFLTGALVPRSLAKIGRAAAAYKAALMKVVDDEARILSVNNNECGGNSSGNTGHGILLTPLVRALQPTNSCQDDDVLKTKKGGLSADEILGNIFTIHFAGHDTVLIALTFSLTLLGINPGVQEWLHNEVTKATQSRPLDAWEYNDIFPRLPRCHAVLLETLRLFAPITGVPKIAPTNAASSSIQVADGRVLVIPPGTEVFPSLIGVQTDPRYWEDPYEWQPSRWIRKRQGVYRVGLGGKEQEDEELLTPLQGTFFPWSGGPQICAGKKFSQVEGVAILARLFSGHKLRVEKQVGETEDQARTRVRDCVNDVNYNLLLRMNHLDRVRLECINV